MANNTDAQEGRRRARIERAVQGIMCELDMAGVYSGETIDDGCLESIAGALRAAISKAERGDYRG